MKTFFSILSRKTKWQCIGILILAVIGSVFASVWPVKLAELYSAISSGEISTIERGFVAIASFGVIFLVAESVTILRRVLMECVVTSNEAHVRQKSVEKMLKMPLSYNFGHNSGEKTAQLNQGVSGMSQLLKILCNDVFATVITAICTTYQVLVNAPGIIAGTMMVYLLITIVISYFQIRSQNGMREKIISKKNHLDGTICQSISNLELIRSMNAEDYESKRLEDPIHAISKTEQTHHRYMGGFDLAKQTCKIVFQLLLLGLSLVLITKGEMAPGVVITVCLLFQQLIKPIDEVYRFMDEIASSLVKAKALTEMFNTDDDPVFSNKQQHVGKDSKDIILESVTVTNPDKSKALAHYDYVCIPGDQRVALIGPSGCGKTTLVRSLCNIYPRLCGKILLFGKSLDAYTQSELADTICYLPQSTFFFSGSIRDNLAYGLKRTVSDFELYEALKNACILDSLAEKVQDKSTAEGSLTTSSTSDITANQSVQSIVQDILSLSVTENGKNFSGGQLQRLTLARAFLRKPKVFILDESTANLDGENMDAVLSNLEAYAQKNGAGICYISHDNRIVSRCDRVVQPHNLLLAETKSNIA